jgi:hypothetical protein
LSRFVHWCTSRDLGNRGIIDCGTGAPGMLNYL